MKEFVTKKKLKLTEDHVLVLRKTKEDGKAERGFVYPSKGWVEAPDWDGGQKECGGGLHGLAWAEGELDIDDYGEFFQVILVNKKGGFVNLSDQKCKYRRGEIVLTSRDSRQAIEFIRTYDANTSRRRMNYDYTANSVANQGYRSVADQQNRSVVYQGDRSIAKQRDRSVANQGNQSIADQGYWSVANQGEKGVAKQWSRSVADQGYDSVANQRDRSVSIAREQSGHSHIHRVGENCVTILYDTWGKPYVYTGYSNVALYFQDCKLAKKYTSTPEEITSIEDWEIFVFGSNLAGEHGGGAARLAQKKFYAESGVGEGRTGQSYAFPTLTKDGEKVTKKDLKESINKLIQSAAHETSRIYLVTKVGCGIAGFKEEEMMELFRARKDMPANIVLPKGWAYWDV